MVRAGVVKHPSDWKQSGYNGVQKPQKRYRIIDYQALMELTQFDGFPDYQNARRIWVGSGIESYQPEGRQHPRILH